MATRTTTRAYQIHVHYGQGWEHELSEDTRAEALQRLKEYRANCPQYPVKLVTRRIPKEGASTMPARFTVETTTTLERHVARWIRERAQDYPDSGAEGVLKDLFYGGCQSGMVGHLVYYADTLPFYKRHAKEIDALLAELCRDTGQSPAELFGDKWDSEDPMARDTNNLNLLAWFGFEETARRLADRAGLDV